MRFALIAVAAALTLAGCGQKQEGGNSSAATNITAPVVPAPNGGDWAQIVSRTPEGGFRMGNPNAPVKLVEYGSITCPHCARFSAEAGDPLRQKYVKTGQVSWEFRPFLIHPQDPAVFQLLGCETPAAYFQVQDQLFATQEQWLGRLEGLPQDQLQQMSNLDPHARGAALVKAMGVDQFFRQRGMPQARIDSCLADDQALQKLVGVTGHATSQEGVDSTPTFIIDGQKQDVSTWAEIEPRLRTALGG